MSGRSNSCVGYWTPLPKASSCAGQGDQPVAYANAAFQRLTGYGSDELVNQDLRRLQGSDREQEGRTQLREGIARGQSCRAPLRNYSKGGSQFWNEVGTQ